MRGLEEQNRLRGRLWYVKLYFNATSSIKIASGIILGSLIIVAVPIGIPAAALIKPAIACGSAFIEGGVERAIANNV